MSAFKNIAGQTFGEWYVIKFSHKDKQNRAHWLCRCNLCGKEDTVSSSSLLNGSSTKCRSCGTRIGKQKKYSGDQVKIMFKGMKQRCYNKKARSYSNYGARGIAICDEWLNNPESFYDWAYANGYAEGMSIERINNNENYRPDNCTFISKHDQSKNRSISIMITINGTTKCLTDWCREYKANPSTVKWRHNHGMEWIDALTS